MRQPGRRPHTTLTPLKCVQAQGRHLVTDGDRVLPVTRYPHSRFFELSPVMRVRLESKDPLLVLTTGGGGVTAVSGDYRPCRPPQDA